MGEFIKQTDEDYIFREDFIAFVNEEFDKTVIHATIEDLAVFVFCSLNEAIKSFNIDEENNDEAVWSWY